MSAEKAQRSHRTWILFLSPASIGRRHAAEVDESRAVLLDWLRKRRPDEPIETVETHISVLAFQGDRAYTLKKAVAFPFLDLSTRERRLEDCEREVALNRRFAPDIYLGVRAVTGRDGEVIDHVVEMVRLPSEHRLGDALLSPVAVLTVDALDKRMRRERPFAPAPDRRDAASSSNG